MLLRGIRNRTHLYMEPRIHPYKCIGVRYILLLSVPLLKLIVTHNTYFVIYAVLLLA